ncbi:tRNA (guanine-N(7)-)-methyltransferase, partial [Megasphaera sp. BL7]
MIFSIWKADERDYKGKWRSLFKNPDAPLVGSELGTGKGNFIS